MTVEGCPQPYLSVVIPAFNESAAIASTVKSVSAYLTARRLTHEMVVADDGSTDSTLMIVRELADRFPIRVVGGPHAGKGAAVKRGVLAAQGQRILFMDADHSTCIEEWAKCAPWLEQGYDLVIGSRKMAGAQVRVHQPPLREFMGKVFTWLTNQLLTVGVTDITCGFKCFHAPTAREIFDRQRIEGWGFDAEILFIAHRLGYRIKEVPVVWSNDESSKVHVIRDAVRSLQELVTIRAGAWRGWYPRDSRDAQVRQQASPSASGESNGQQQQPAARSRLSVVILTKNEERRIARCLSHLSWVDDIVVVDGLSEDRTVEIARQHGARVIQRRFSGSFADERNAGLDAATGEWVLQLDADDVVTPQMRQAVEQLLRTDDGRYDAYKFRRQSVFLGHRLAYGAWTHYIPHVLRRSKARYVGRVHERPNVPEPLGVLHADIEHWFCDRFEEFVGKVNRYTSLAAQQWAESGERFSRWDLWYRGVLRPGKLFWKLYVKKQGFRDGVYGRVMALQNSWTHVINTAKCWELTRMPHGLFAHERLTVDGYLVRMNQGSTIEAATGADTPQQNLARRLWVRPAITFWQTYVREQGYQAGWPGWFRSVLVAYGTFVTHVKRWEQRRDA